MKLIYYCLIFFFFVSFQCEKDLTAIKPPRFNWPISTPEEQGLDNTILSSASSEANQLGFVDALLIIKNGYLIKEEYFNDFDKFTPHNIKSVSKSFLSAITGVALQSGYIDSLDEKVLDYFPEYIYPGIDQRKYNITIEHLLTMRMGIASESDNNYRVYHSLYTSNNWIKSTIEYPLVYNPGEQMRYNTFQTHLLSAIITKATNQSTKDFTTDHLFKNMNIDVDGWEQDPQGYYFGGNSMFFTPREIAVLGYLYLNKGKLHGMQILTEQWVQLTISPSSNFTHPNSWGALINYNYGYLWWLGEIGGYQLYMGLGYGGQYVIVFPDLNLIVVSTSESEVYPDQAEYQELAILSVVEDFILAAIK